MSDRERDSRRDRRGNSLDEEERIARLIRLGQPGPAISPELERRVHGAVRDAWSEATGRRRRSRWLAPLAAAASLAAVGLLVSRTPLFEEAPLAPVATVAELRGVFQSLEDNRRLLAGDAIEAGAVLRTSDVSRAALALADGTSVRLDHGTELTMLADRRISLDRGAIYIDTGPEADAGGRGLTVLTPHAVATDIGTQFEVRLTGEATLVRVREGQVDVDASDGEAQRMRAGSAAIVAPGGGIRTQPVAIADASWDWTQQVAPPFEMGNRTLDEFLAWAARELGLALRFDGEAAAAANSVRLTGSVEGLPPRDALDAVMRTTALAYRLEQDRLIVYRP